MIVKGISCKWLFGVMIGACVVIIVGTVIYCTFLTKSSSSELPLVWGIFSKAAVVSNSPACAEIGMKILRKYGNAVDAAIATMICDGVGCPQSMGIGGGFFMTIYRKGKGATVLDARETAPAAATMDMYQTCPEKAQFGPLSSGVPGELRGYEEAWRKFGGAAPWQELFAPTVDLARNGVPVTEHMAKSINDNKDLIRNDTLLREMLLKESGEIPKPGDKLKFKRLANFLQRVAEYGNASLLYDGELSKAFVEDIRDGGGIITEDDMRNYRPLWVDPLRVELSGNLTLYSVPPPGSGAILGLVLRLLDGYLPSENVLTDTQRITEAFKFAYARRTSLGDPAFTDVSKVLADLQNDDYIRQTRNRISDTKTVNNATWYGADFVVPEDHGTANVVVMAPNGDAVVATSTVNLIFGSKFISKSTGVLLNNEMDDFSSPNIVNAFDVAPSPANYIKAGKRPLSSMCPSVIANPDGSVRLAIGAAGGSKITSATSLVSIWNLWFNKTLQEAISTPRFHHQDFPMKWQYEENEPKSIVKGMMGIGHVVWEEPKSSISSTVTVVGSQREHLTAVSDPRRPGSVAGLELPTPPK